MKKFKPCKGIGKARGFECCGKDIEAKFRKYGLCLKCYAVWLYSTDEGLKQVERETLKVVSVRKKQQEDLERVKNERTRSNKLQALIDRVKTHCHEYVRLRDKYKPCVSCGCQWHSDFDAGHWKKAELFSSVRFNENNIHGQCIRCNRMKDGNVQEYDIGIKKRVDQDKIDEILNSIDNERKNGFKWDRQDLNEKLEYYKRKIKQLKKSD